MDKFEPKLHVTVPYHHLDGSEVRILKKYDEPTPDQKITYENFAEYVALCERNSKKQASTNSMKRNQELERDVNARKMQLVGGLVALLKYTASHHNSNRTPNTIIEWLKAVVHSKNQDLAEKLRYELLALVTEELAHTLAKGEVPKVNITDENCANFARSYEKLLSGTITDEEHLRTIRPDIFENNDDALYARRVVGLEDYTIPRLGEE